MSYLYIYLHGFASGTGSRKAQYFIQRFREFGVPLLVPELSEGNFPGLTITGQLDLLERLADGRPVRLIGSSLGGYLAALYAARHGETDRIVLLAPAFGFARRWPERLGEKVMADWKRTGRMPVHHYGENTERLIGYQLIEDGLRYEDVPTVSQPVLVFHGTRDTVVPPSFSEEFVARQPNAQLHLVDTDHEMVDVMSEMWSKMEGFLLS